MSGGVAVIVVNYGVADLAIAAVESVRAQGHGGRAVEVHLVDNASPGDDAARLSEAHGARGWGEGVRLWLQDENLGFGRGNNLVLSELLARRTPPEFVFLLNPDAVLLNEVVDILAGALEAAPEAGAAGAGILGEDGRPEVAAFRFPSPVSEVVRTLGIGVVERAFSRRQVALPAETDAGEVDWLTGAAVMFRLKSLGEVGLFDPGFFLYYEEVDLMRRLGEAGWRKLYLPQAQVRHVAGAATGRHYDPQARKRHPDYVYRSWRRYFVKTFGRPVTLATSVAVVVAGALNVAHLRLRGRRPYVPLHFFSDHWRHVLRPLLTGRAG